MPVTFEFEAKKDFHFAAAFANRFNIPIVNERVKLPEILGDGFIQEIFLSNGLTLCIHNYVLNQELILKRRATGSTNVLTLKFDCRKILQKFNEDLQNSLFADSKACEVEFGTSNFFSELKVLPNQVVSFLVISTTRQTLIDLLKLGPEGNSVTYRLKDNQSFILFEAITREMERALKQLSQINQSTKLPVLLYQIKAQELIYFLFAKLFSRANSISVKVNPADAEKIYEIRSTILFDLSISPQLPDLAAQAGMSLTKMKQLFQQIFGKSIYNYYQAERMEEAAQLLNYLSVSDTGYKVGFTNLSHFTRLFEKHHQMKPKQYKNTLKVNNQ